MKNMMKKLLTQWNVSRNNNKGMTFVEVICAVAIFALVSSTIGGIIVFSARTYRKGVSETSVQQEAQLAANNIGNIIKDACSVQYGESNQQIRKDGEDLVTDESGSPKIQPDGTTELAIITNNNIQYSITYVEAAKTLLYTEIDPGNSSAPVTPQIMAKNISSFSADTDDFKNSRTIKLNMTVEDESTGRSIPMSYTMTSRNEVAEDMTFVSTSDEPVIIFLESDVTLVPGEAYSIPIAVVGKLSKGLENGSGTSNVDVGTITTEYVEVTVPKDTTAGSGFVQIQTKDKKTNEDGSDSTVPKAVGSTNINIRRVDDIKVTYAINSNDAEDGAYESKDAQYIFYANVSGTHLAKSPGSSWDSGYKKAQAVYWKYSLEVGGNTYTYVSDQTGEHYSDQVGIEQYVKFMESNEDVDKPSLRVRIMQNMPDDFVLTVTATSKHTDGVNKANSKYPNEALNVSGNVVITPRPTKASGKEITLEPYETGEILMDMKGGRVTKSEDVTFIFNGATDLASDWNATEPDFTKSGTKAKYDVATDTVRIKLGKDEMGAGSTYTFTIDVLIKGDKKSEIIVHVRRLDKIWVGIVPNKDDPKTRDFRARINVDKDQGNNQETTKYLYDVMYDTSLSRTEQEKIVAQTLASRITWEYFDYSKSKTTPVHKDSVICMGGVEKKGAIIGDFTMGYDEYAVVGSSKNNANIKPARIEKDADGNWYIKQYPEIDISILGSKGNLSPNTELRVTIEMLHPQGVVDGMATNKTATAYHDIDIETGEGEWVVYASASLYGSNNIIVADGFKRGKDYVFFSDSDIVSMQQDIFGWWTCLEQASFYRYREVGGTFGKYHMMDSKQGNWATANYVPMSYLFRPDKEYEIEIVSVVYNKTDKLIYWPLDQELLEEGRGWSEAGFTFWNPTQEQWKKDHPSASQYYRPYSWYQECYDKVQQVPEVKQTFLIPKSEMSFYKREGIDSDTLTVNETVTSVGSESAPIRLNGTNGSAEGSKGFIVNLAITGYEMNTDQQCFRTIVQKKSGGKWVTLGYDDNNVIHDGEGFKVDSANPYISIYRTGNAEGLYRVVPVIITGEKIKWRDVTDTPHNQYTDMDVLFEPEYTTTDENYHLYDYATGKYVIYFEFYR